MRQTVPGVKEIITRMHSSRMRNGRSLTIGGGVVNIATDQELQFRTVEKIKLRRTFTYDPLA